MKNRCCQCNEEHDAESMVAFGGDWVCEECKPTYVQALKEGVSGTFPTSSYSRTALISWERLRLVFNAILLAEGITLSWSTRAYFGGDVRYLLNVLAFGLIANVFFSIGPLFDLYLYILFRRRLGLWRYLLFTTGMLGSIWLVAMIALQY